MNIIHTVFAVLVLVTVSMALAVFWADLSPTIQILSAALILVYFFLLLSPLKHLLLYLCGSLCLLLWSLCFLPVAMNVPLFAGGFFFLFRSPYTIVTRTVFRLCLQGLTLVPVYIVRPNNVGLFAALCSAHIFVWVLLFFLRIEHRNTRTEIELLRDNILAKDKILATLAHELRTPLTVIRTSTDILLEERTGKINEQQQKFLYSTQKSTEGMIVLTENILARLRLKHADLKMNKKTLDLRVLVQKVCKNMELLISEKKQTIQYFYPSLLPSIVADGNWIEQVLINLIYNSSKHLEENGRIVVSVKENERYVLVSVSDNGVGIRQNEKLKIFTEYYRGQDSVTNKTDGSGLGLAIVRDVVEKHRGKIYLSSAENLGVTVTFTLPKK